MYKVVTYRSRPLKKKDVVLNITADDKSAVPFDESKSVKKGNKAGKKGSKGDKIGRKGSKRGNKFEEKTYIIAGEEVRESDLTDDERADVFARQAINKDGFYTALEPIDISYVDYNKRGGVDTKKVVMVAGIIIVAIVLVVGVLAVAVL